MFNQRVFGVLSTILLIAASQAQAARNREILTIDRYQNLTPEIPFVDTLSELDRPELSKAIAPTAAWHNDGEWSMAEGLIANRYRDEGYTGRLSWRDRREYLMRTNVRRVYEMKKGSDRNEAINRMSPAEKYDLLVGLLDDGLTTALIKEVSRFSDAGRLYDWLGICEGIAAASVSVPKPTETVEMIAFDGVTKVRFSAVDIQGLAAFLWSEYTTRIGVVGARCEGGNENDPACFDTNPGTFHVGMLNIVGLRKQPLMGDFSNDSEVWNYPVQSYKLRYFNPQNRSFYDSAVKASIPMQNYKDDRFKSKRSPKAVRVVGVQMSFGISTANNDGGSDFEVTYDLEIDSNGVIIGGEWDSGDHPDFLWAIPPGFKPSTVGDQLLPQGATLDRTASAEWTSAAKIGAARIQPLALVINRLVELSAKQQQPDDRRRRD